MEVRSCNVAASTCLDVRSLLYEGRIGGGTPAGMWLLLDSLSASGFSI